MEVLKLIGICIGLGLVYPILKINSNMTKNRIDKDLIEFLKLEASISPDKKDEYLLEKERLLKEYEIYCKNYKNL